MPVTLSGIAAELTDLVSETRDLRDDPAFPQLLASNGGNVRAAVMDLVRLRPQHAVGILDAAVKLSRRVVQLQQT